MIMQAVIVRRIHLNHLNHLNQLHPIPTHVQLQYKEVIAQTQNIHVIHYFMVKFIQIIQVVQKDHIVASPPINKIKIDIELFFYNYVRNENE